jgi:hypothetical protein
MKRRTIEEFLGSYPSDVRALALEARRLIRQILTDVEERVDTSAPVVGYGYGAGYRGVVCTLILSKSGVKLGLARGSELRDPHGLLAGSGKVHRYVQLREPTDVRRAGVRQLIKASHVAARKRISAEPTGRPRRRA